MLLALVSPALASSWSALLPDLWRPDGEGGEAPVSISGGEARAGVIATLVQPAEAAPVVNEPFGSLEVVAALDGLGGDAAVCWIELSAAGFRRVVKDPVLPGQAACGGTLDVSGLPPGTWALDVTARQGLAEVAYVGTDVLLNDAPVVRLGHASFDGASRSASGGTIDLDLLIEDEHWVSGAGTLTIAVVDPNGDGWTEVAEAPDAPGTPAAPDPGEWPVRIVHNGAAGSYALTATWEDGHGGVGTLSWTVMLVDDPIVSLTTDVTGDHVEPGAEVVLTAEVLNRSGPYGTAGDLRVQREEADGSWTDVGSCTTASHASNPSCDVTWPSGAGRGWSQFRATFEEQATGASGASATVGVLVDDAPALEAWWETDGTTELIVGTKEPAAYRAVVVDEDVLDGDAAGETLSLEVLDATGAVVYRGDTDFWWSGTYGKTVLATATLGAWGTYEAWLTYEDPYGLVATAGPLTLHVNAEPEVTLTGVTTGSVEDLDGDVLRIPEGEPAYGSLTIAFETWDEDDSELTVAVTSEAGLGRTLRCPTSGEGDCTYALRNLDAVSAGTYDVTVTVSDDVETVEATLLTIEVVDPSEFDLDADGYTETAGDCEPENPAVNPGEVDLCDDVDNDCDGQVNEDELESDNEYAAAADAGEAYYAGTVQDDDATSIADSTGATCEVSGTSECVATGSLYAEDDVDWWAFEVGEDRGGRYNAAFSVEIRVPSAAIGETSVSPWDWALDLRVSDDGTTWYTMAEMAALTGIEYVTEPVAVNVDDPDFPTLTWGVTTAESYDDQLYWRAGIGSTSVDEDASWNAAMCGTSGATVYTLTVRD